ncbi:MAG: hypothetical protein JWN49_692 [Parcubacteria group bacterium]|nr:hypothetical protein [Parcubacteria group bacterium]
MATAAPLQPAEECEELRIIREHYGFGADISDERIIYHSRMIHDGSRDIDMRVSQEMAKLKATGVVPYHIIRCSQRDVRYPRAWVDSVKRTG